MPPYDSSDDGNVVVIGRPRSRVRHGSPMAAYDVPERYGPPALLEGNNYLATDLLSVHRSSGRGRQRSSSVNINIDRSRGPSHDRRWERSRGRCTLTSSSSSSSSEEDIGYGDHIRHRHHRYSSRADSKTDPELAVKLFKLKILEEKERELQERKRIREGVECAKFQEAYDLAERKKRKKELLEEAQREEDAKMAQEMKQKKEEDRRFAEKFIAQLLSLGYTEEQARAMLQRRRDKESMTMGPSKPTWIRVHRKYLAIETLEFYSLPWEWGEDREYIVIKKWVSPEFQDELFAHSRRIFDVTEVKEKKLIMGPIEKDTVTTLKVRGRNKDQMYLVRKKSTSNARSKSSGFVYYT